MQTLGNIALFGAAMTFMSLAALGVYTLTTWWL